MKEKIESLRALVRERAQKLESLQELEKLRSQLVQEGQKLEAKLGTLPPAALAVPDGESERFGTATTSLVRSLRDVQTKLELVPGIRVRYEAEAEGLSMRIRDAVRSLIKDLRRAAQQGMLELQAEQTGPLIADCGSIEIRQKAEKSQMEKWYEAFQYYDPPIDSTRNAERAIDLAERFMAGKTCP